MRINIAAKLFLGFLVVIFLNVFFVVVVSKVADLNSITKILKRQNEVKNALLRVGTLHNAQARSCLFFQRLKRTESADNFRELGKSVGQLLDTVVNDLNVIRMIDTMVSPREVQGPERQGLLELVHLVNNRVTKANGLYNRSFENLVGLQEKSATRERRKQEVLLKEVIAKAADTLTARLDRAEAALDEQTRIRIKDVEQRVDNIKKLTLIILVSMSAFALIFGLFFSRAITVSLRRLRESTSTIAKGNFDFDPKGYPNDEIGDLARAFFDMAYDLKNAQEELVRSKRLAAIGEVVASANHEINNPLMIISGNAQFLEMSMDGYPDELRERVRAIIEETERISRVTRKLREIRNPIVEDYTSSGEQMINLDKSSG